MTREVLSAWLKKMTLCVWFMSAPIKLVPMIGKGWCFFTSCLTITFWSLPYLHTYFCEYSTMSPYLLLVPSIIAYKTGAASLSHAFSLPFSFSSLFCRSILPLFFDAVSYVRTPSSSSHSFPLPMQNSIWILPFCLGPNNWWSASCLSWICISCGPIANHSTLQYLVAASSVRWWIFPTVSWSPS